MSRTDETGHIEWHKCVINNLFGILVIVSVNVIKHVILVNIWIMKIVSAEKN